jgi:hypothetical protein
MKKILIFFLAVVFLCIPAGVRAVEMHSGNTVVIDTPMTEDVIVTGSTITINAPITGDVIAAGGMIQINARIDGDLIVGAGQLVINDEITGKILAGCGTFDLWGNAEKAIIVGGQLTIHSESVIEKYVIAAGGTVTNEGTVKEEFYVSAEDFDNTGTVGELNIAEPESVDRADIGAFFGTLFAILGILAKIGLLILGLLFIKFFPRLFYAIESEVRISPVVKTIVGFIMLIVTIIMIIILMITVIGFPIGAMLGLFFGMILMVAGLFVSYSLGDWITQKLNISIHHMLVFTVGFIIINVLYYIPYVGTITRIIVVSLGFGAVFYSVKNNWGTITAQP